MAGELLGPDANSRTVWLAPGVSAHGRTATVYTDSAATSLAAILTYDGTGTPGAAITGSQVTIDANSEIPQFWFPAGSDTLYARVNGLARILKLNADTDARLDTVAGITQAAAVADQGALTASAPAALTASAPAALTSTNAAGATPTDDEFDALRADVTELRTKLAAAIVDLAALRTSLAAAVTDAATARTKVNALLGSLRTAGVIDT